MSASDVFTDVLAAAAQAHRANEVLSDNDLLVDGRLIVTEAAWEALKRDATYCYPNGAVSNAPPGVLPQWSLVQVEAIPDDGAAHDIGNGKRAVVSPLDHKTILVFPAEFLDPLAPQPMRLLPDNRYPLL